MEQMETPGVARRVSNFSDSGEEVRMRTAESFPSFKAARKVGRR